MPKIQIFTKKICPYCQAAKALLSAKGAKFEEIDVETDDKIRDELIEKTGQTTVPQIFIDDKSYGGFTDLKALDDEGKLDEILKTQ